jgi:hypothetical protein
VADFINDLMRFGFSLGRSFIWTKTKEIYLLKKAQTGADKGQLVLLATVDRDWLAYRLMDGDGRVRTENKTTLVDVLIVETSRVVLPTLPGPTRALITQAVMDQVAAVAVQGKIYQRKENVEPFAAPGFYQLTVSPTGETWN